MPKSRKKYIKSIYDDHENENENNENGGEGNEEELKQSQIQENQIHNINQMGMIVTKSGDTMINSLTIIGQIVIIDNKIYLSNNIA